MSTEIRQLGRSECERGDNSTNQNVDINGDSLPRMFEMRTWQPFYESGCRRQRRSGTSNAQNASVVIIPRVGMSTSTEIRRFGRPECERGDHYTNQNVDVNGDSPPRRLEMQTWRPLYESGCRSQGRSGTSNAQNASVVSIL